MTDAVPVRKVPTLTSLDEAWHRRLRPVGTLLVDVFHYVGLFVIGAATVWAAGWSFADMMSKKHHASIDDLLLLFIFLEIGAMVGIYFKLTFGLTRIWCLRRGACRHHAGNGPGRCGTWARNSPDRCQREFERSADHVLQHHGPTKYKTKVAFAVHVGVPNAITFSVHDRLSNRRQ